MQVDMSVSRRRTDAVDRNDWRWMLERSDSPWYPSLKLYRQAKPGDWAPVIAAAAADLTGL